MFKRFTKLPLLMIIMGLMLVLTVSMVSAHDIATDLNSPPTLEKTTDGTTAYGGKHVVWEHAHLDQPWKDRGWGDRWLPQNVEVNVGNVLNWGGLNHLNQTTGCVTTHSRSYSTTAIYGASNDLVAQNAHERNDNNDAALSGDWGLGGVFTHVGTVYVYRVTMGFTGTSGNGTFNCLMWEKYQFRVSE